jgi:hypothetical protein
VVGWLQGCGQNGTCRQAPGLTAARSLAQKLGTVFRRHLVADAAVWALGVVFLPERTGDHLLLHHAADQLPIEAFVPEAPIEALVQATLPRTSRLDEADSDSGLREPFLQHPGHELTHVVAPRVQRRPMDRDRRLQRPDHLRGPQL